MPETEPNPVVKVFKIIGAIVGTTLAMITLLTFFFAPVLSDLESIKTDFTKFSNDTNLRLERITTKQLQIEADVNAHKTHGHESTDIKLGEVRDESIKMREQITRFTRDLEQISNRQQTQINQVANLRAEVAILNK